MNDLTEDLKQVSALIDKVTALPDVGTDGVNLAHQKRVAVSALEQALNHVAIAFKLAQ